MTSIVRDRWYMAAEESGDALPQEPTARTPTVRRRRSRARGDSDLTRPPLRQVLGGTE
jgi:hypothetical protein